VLFLLQVLYLRASVAKKISSHPTGLIVDPSQWKHFKVLEPIVREDLPIPQNFDARTKWRECESIGYVYNQGKCGFCWAVGTASVVTDRYCIHMNETQKNEQFIFSIEDLAACCCDSKHPCDGGNDLKALEYIKKNGLVSGGDMDSNKGCRPLTRETTQLKIKPPCTGSCTNTNYSISYTNDKKKKLQKLNWFTTGVTINL